MATLKYSTDELIEEVRNRGSLGDNNAKGFLDADIIRYLNAEMYNELVPRVLKVREEYFVVRQRKTVAARVRIDPRAIGNRLRELVHIDTDGMRSNLPRIDPSQFYYFNQDLNEAISGFSFEGNHVIPVPPEADLSGEYEMSWFFRPGQLVLIAEGREVASITDANTVEVTSAIPASFAVGVKVDVHSGFSGAEIKTWSNVLAAGTTSTTVNFTDNIDGSVGGTTAVEVGDYVVLENEAVIPGLPRELHPILAQAATARILEADGDEVGVKLATAELNRMLLNMNYLIDDRIEGQAQKIVNRGSLLWKGRGYRRGW